MNPLDKEELKAFLKIIKKNMPLHTERTAKIKRSFSQGMPKNLMDYSVKVDNKFLNDNLHTIEEMEYRKKGITNDFKNYQHKYYDESGILNHDLYFKHDDKIYAKVRGGSYFNQNGLSFSNASLNRTVPVINGATIETNDGSGGSGASRGINVIELAKFPNTGVVGTSYDQLSYRGSLNLGNIEMGVYAEDTPNALLVNSGSIAAYTTYAMQSVTQFQLTHTQNWFAWNNNAGAEWYYKTVTNGTKTKAVTFGSMPNPAGSGYSTTTTTIQGKMAHS